MVELRDPTARESYIRERASGMLECAPSTIRIEFIDKGCLNYVYSASSGRKRIFFKQSLSTAKHSNRLGPELATLSATRTAYEAQILDMLREIASPDYVIPTVLDFDRKYNILILSDAGDEGSQTLDDVFEKGPLKLNTAQQLGAFLGVMHRQTVGKGLVLRGSKEDDLSHWAKFLRLRTSALATRTRTDRVAQRLEILCRESISKRTRSALLFIDFCPKNIIQRSDNCLGVLDPELACGVGDPIYDLGFMLGDSLCHFTKSAVSSKQIQEFIFALVDSYLQESRTTGDTDFYSRLAGYAAAIFIYRADGSSPDQSLNLVQKEILKKTAYRILSSSEGTTSLRSLASQFSTINEIQLSEVAIRSAQLSKHTPDKALDVTEWSPLARKRYEL